MVPGRRRSQAVPPAGAEGTSNPSICRRVGWRSEPSLLPGNQATVDLHLGGASSHTSSFRSSVCSDGRRSSTVTKMFVVQSGGSNLEKVLEVGRQVSTRLPGRHGNEPEVGDLRLESELPGRDVHQADGGGVSGGGDPPPQPGDPPPNCLHLQNSPSHQPSAPPGWVGSVLLGVGSVMVLLPAPPASSSGTLVFCRLSW